MEKKFKSANDVFNQMARIRENYATFDNTKKENPWLYVASRIADHYLDEIARHIELCKKYGNYSFSKNASKEHDPHRIKFAHVIRSYVEDTSREEIAKIEPYYCVGLYFIDDDGNKVTPHSLYFGCDSRLFHEPTDAYTNGKCYCHYDNALHPVMLPNGKRYIRRDWANVTCRYKDGRLYDFYRE